MASGFRIQIEDWCWDVVKDLIRNQVRYSNRGLGQTPGLKLAALEIQIQESSELRGSPGSLFLG